jgi:hypothetical protein
VKRKVKVKVKILMLAILLPLLFSVSCADTSDPAGPIETKPAETPPVETQTSETAPDVLPETDAPQTDEPNSDPDFPEAVLEDPDAKAGVYTDGFAFVYNGELIYMGDHIEDVAGRLGAALDYIESESCTSEGMMISYYYSGAEISAYAKAEGDSYRIFSIILTDDSVTTAEGLYIGQSESEMTAVYGTDYQSVPGVCKYSKSGTGLTFDIEDDGTIICITYTLLEI